MKSTVAARAACAAQHAAVRRGARLVAVVLIVVATRGAGAEVLGGRPISSGASPDLDAWLACAETRPQSPECRSRRAVAVPALAEDLRALGASGNFLPVPLLIGALASPEPELRAAAADGIGMIRPTPAETPALAAAFNDPVPAVRQSARLALGASNDPRAQALAGRALRADRWKGFAADRDPDLGRLGIPVYAGATPLRFAVDLTEGSAQLATADALEKVIAFYAGRAGSRALSLDEFAAAYPEGSSSWNAEEEDSGDDDSGMPSEADMARAMAMMQKMNEAMASGKSIEQVGLEMGGAGESAESAASAYSNTDIYGSPRVVVLEENDLTGRRKPVRYVVVYLDQTLGRTGIALHGPPTMP